MLFAALLCAAPYAANAQCGTPPTLIGAITPPPGTLAGDYVADFLSPGSVYYTDATPTLEQIPSELDCAHWIKTRNADATASDATFLEFSVLEPVDVYVLYDMRVAAQPERSPPDWLLNDFSYEHLVVDVDAETSGATDIDMEFLAYRKRFPAGTVSLGANAATGADFNGDDGVETSMYIVAVTRPTAALPMPTCTTPPVLISTITPPVVCDSPCSYVRASNTVGSAYYTDRGATHTLARLTPDIACADWIKTQNDDKHNTEDDLPSFVTSQSSVVYIAYDTRIALQQRAVPDWITTQYTNTLRILDLTESDRDQEFLLYAKGVPAGTVMLGGNRATPGVPQEPSTSNYIVAVAPDGDADGVADTIDNCASDANAEQADNDADGLGDACDPCTLADDPGQTGWDPLGTPPPDFGVCPLPMENGLSFTGLQARDDHLFVVDLGNFPLRPEYDVVVTPTSAGTINLFTTVACNVDPADPSLYDVASPGNGFTRNPVENVQIWKGYQSQASRQGTLCIVGIVGDPASTAGFDLDLDILASVPAADTRNYDPITQTFTAASPDFAAEGTNHRWVFPGTAGVGQCQPFPLAAGLQNPGETNEGPAEASYVEEVVPAENDIFDCCTWTYESVDGVRAIPAVVEFPVGNPTVPLVDTDGDFFPDRCDVCTGLQDLQFDEDRDLTGADCEVDDTDPNRCFDQDADGCDDCAAGTGVDAGADGLDTDSDGICDNSDADAIPDDGDGSFVAGDTPCTGGESVSCDDNCPLDDNPLQEDPDADGVGSACDVCPDDFNPLQTPAACTGVVPAMPLTGLLLTAASLLAAGIVIARSRRA
jgi:hypothetical protein